MLSLIDTAVGAVETKAKKLVKVDSNGADFILNMVDQVIDMEQSISKSNVAKGLRTKSRNISQSK